VSFLDHFTHVGPHGEHVCMVFEVLGENLLGLVKRYQSTGVPRGLVRQIAKQMLLGLDYMHRCCGIIHTGVCILFSDMIPKAEHPRTDLKPENVLVVLDDIEARIATELCASAPPSARLVGVPPSTGRGGNQTPRGDSFYITGSQPLPSPSTSPGQGLIHDRFKFGMSALEPARVLDEATRGVSQISLGSPPPAPAKPAGLSILSQQLAASRPATLPTPPSSTATSPPPALAPLSPPAMHATTSTVPSPSERMSLALDETLRAQASLSNAAGPATAQITVKLADLGNATWVEHHFAEDIQTRQYRCPEVILGARWGPSADVWSVACVLFELLTGGDYLFDPTAGARYNKDDDHIAQIIELTGPIPRALAFAGTRAQQLFRRTGELRHIHKLRFWPLDAVLREKYLYDPAEAELVAGFLGPMLRTEPERRASAREMLEHPILDGIEVRGEVEVRERARRRGAAHAAVGGVWPNGTPVLGLPAMQRVGAV
jgi:serine/threonine-protein kinase SRPK3